MHFYCCMLFVEIANALAVAYLNFHASKSNQYELNTCMGFL